jgi:hypothetical protein
MARINFLYRGKKENGKLSIRLIHGKEIDYRISSPLESKKEYWYRRTSKKNGKTGYRHIQLKDLSTSSAELKAHKNRLVEIQKNLIDSFIKDYNNNIPITKDWLKLNIKKNIEVLDTKEKIKVAAAEHHNITNSNLLGNAIEKMFITYATNKNELKKFKVTSNLLKEYEENLNTKFSIKDLNQIFADNFKNWAFNEMQYSKSYINAILKRFRRSAVRAYENDEKEIIEVSRTLRTFKMFDKVYKNKIVITLDYDELDKIDRTNITESKLFDAKKAILIGCETGLRYSDQNKLIDTNIRNIDGVNYWEFRTEKTDSLVQITITQRILNLINKYGLPQTNYPDNGVQLNRDIKEVCRQSGISKKIKGSKATVKEIKGKKATRNINDYHPKHMLITSRTFRRSFATNYYGKIDTPLIMKVTGHSTEKMLRAYINVSDAGNITKTKLQIDQYHEERKQKKNNIKLTVIPKIINS